MKRRRLQYGTGILVVSFLVVTICFGTILHLVDQMDKNRIMDNALYSRNQREFAIVSTENEDLWQEVIPRISKEWNGVMYLPIESSDIIVRGIYTSGDDQVPPMIYGDFFSKKTSWTTEKTIVVGKKLMDEIYEEGGNYYYRYGEDVYHVIGVMGTDKDSKINNMLLIDFRAAQSLSGVESRYVIDGKNVTIVQVLMQNIKKHIGEQAEVIMPNDSMQYGTSGARIVQVISVALVVSFGLCLVLVSDMWFKFRANLRYVWTLCGIAQWRQKVELVKTYCIISVMGSVVGYIVCVLAWK